MSDIYQPSLFEANDAPLRLPVSDVVERIRPESIPEEAWLAMQAVRNRKPTEPLFPGNPRPTRSQMEHDNDVAYIRSLR